MELDHACLALPAYGVKSCFGTMLQGDTPFHHAAEGGHGQVVLWLLTRPGAASEVQNNNVRKD